MPHYRIGARVALKRVKDWGGEKPLQEVGYRGRPNERVVFPARGYDLPPMWEPWVWEIVGENPRKTVWFARPIFPIADNGVDNYTYALSKRVEDIRRVIEGGKVVVTVGDRGTGITERRHLRRDAAERADALARAWFDEKYAAIDAVLREYGVARMGKHDHIKKSPDEPDTYFWHFVWDRGVVSMNIDCAVMPEVPPELVARLAEIVGWEPHFRKTARWYVYDSSPGFGPHGTDFDGGEW